MITYIKDTSTINAVNTTTGKKIWSYKIKDKEDGINNDPVLANNSNSLLYVTTWKGKVYGINTLTGKQKWEFTPKEFKADKTYGRAILGSLVTTNNRIYISTHNNKIYSIDAANGAEKWCIQAGLSDSDEPPMISVLYGVVYVYKKASIQIVI